MKFDDISTRMKEQYESRTRFMLPRRTYTIFRLDGKAFHTYTKNCKKPFDNGLSDDLDSATMALMKEVQGAKFAYLQSDEISILVTDFDDIHTCAWFDGNIQKISSVSASIMTSQFNKNRFFRYMSPRTEDEHLDLKNYSLKWLYDGVQKDINEFKLANFDARCFTIPDRTEVMNYFIWRNQDCIRNSISMIAYANFSHKALEGKSTPQKIEMLEKEGIKLTDFSNKDLFGRLIVKEQHDVGDVIRSKFVSNSAWKFTDNNTVLLNMIPEYNRG